MEKIFHAPSHPYTHALLQSLPRVDEVHHTLQVIPGAPPDLRDLPPECPFIPRCSKALSICRTSPRPLLAPVGEDTDHTVACFNPVLHSW